MLTGLIRIGSLIGGFWAAVQYHARLARWLADEWGWADSLAVMLKPLVKLPEPFNSPDLLRLPVNLLKQISGQIPLPSPWPDIIGNLNRMGPEQSVGQAINLLLAQGILKILAFIGIFLAVRFVVNFLGAITSGALNFSPLGPANKLAGLLLGLVTGMVIIVVLITILLPLQVPLALLGIQGIPATLESGIRTSLFITVFGPPVQEMGIIPPLFPEFSTNFLIKYFNFGTEI